MALGVSYDAKVFCFVGLPRSLVVITSSLIVGIEEDNTLLVSSTTFEPEGKWRSGQRCYDAFAYNMPIY